MCSGHRAAGTVRCGTAGLASAPRYRPLTSSANLCREPSDCRIPATLADHGHGDTLDAPYARDPETVWLSAPSPAERRKTPSTASPTCSRAYWSIPDFGLSLRGRRRKHLLPRNAVWKPGKSRHGPPNTRIIPRRSLAPPHGVTSQRSRRRVGARSRWPRGGADATGSRGHYPRRPGHRRRDELRRRVVQRDRRRQPAGDAHHRRSCANRTTGRCCRTTPRC